MPTALGGWIRFLPAINRRAIGECPSGTRRRERRVFSFQNLRKTKLWRSFAPLDRARAPDPTPARSHATETQTFSRAYGTR